MSARTFVTGFLAFGNFDVNPSALLAQSCERRYELLEVSFRAVDAFLDRARGDDSFDRLVMLGVRAGGSCIQLERVAHNIIGDTPDVTGQSRPGPIDPAGPATIPSTLALQAHCSDQCSDHAGTYLCNYALYRALQRLPDKRVTFLHVPPLHVIPLETQRQQLAQLLGDLERSSGRLSTTAGNA